MTLSFLSEMIKQSFTADLLSAPMPKLRQDSEDLIKMYQNARGTFERKKKGYSHQKIAKVEADYKTFLELYAKISEKEEELKKEGSYQKKMSFYYFFGVTGDDKAILRRFMR